MSDTVYDVFHARALEQPEALAVLDDTRALTFRELDELVSRFADRLPADARRIGVIMDHSIEMIAALLAILKNGAAYIPAEPDFPPERIKAMLKESEADLVLTQEAYAERFELPVITIEALPDLAPDSAPHQSAEPDDLAYVLYTSGTTGRPKGVMVLNRNITNYVRAFEHEFHPHEGDIMAQHSVCSFDIFTEEVFASLLNGAALAIPDKETRDNLDRFLNFIRRHNLTMISGFPYLLQDMNGRDDIPKSLRLLISGGDVIRQSYIDKLVPQFLIYNTYGPSETTVCASYYNCTAGEPLEDGTYPIGKPVQGVQIEILDENGNVLPQGRIGEIIIRGNGVSAGYMGDHEEENKAFVTLEDGSRLYHSGDLGYYLPDGNLAFLHRKDEQVMILGRRVEPEEIENLLLQNPKIHQATVLPQIDEHGLSYMTAYVVLAEDTPVSKLREDLARYVPPFMIPEYFVQLQSLPLTINGKVDTASLPLVMKEGRA